MTVVVDVSVPADALTLGCIFDDNPGAEIELEPVVPTEEGVLPYFWLSDGDGAFEDAAATLRDHRHTKTLNKLTEVDEAALFEVVWEPTVDRAVSTLRNHHCGCMEATGTSDGWDLQLRFKSHERVTAFNKALTEEGVPVTLTRLCEFEETPRASAATPSPEQLEAVELAHRYGYFEVPRGCTISDIAEEIGISNSACSERLRRGLSAIVEKRSGDA